MNMFMWFINNLTQSQSVMLIQFIMSNIALSYTEVLPAIREASPFGTWHDLMRSRNTSKYGSKQVLKFFSEFWKQNGDLTTMVDIFEGAVDILKDIRDAIIDWAKAICPSCFGDETPALPETTGDTPEKEEPPVDDSTHGNSSVPTDESNSTSQGRSIDEARPAPERELPRRRFRRPLNYVREYQNWHEYRFLARERAGVPFNTDNQEGLHHFIGIDGILTGFQLFGIFMRILRKPYIELSYIDLG